MNKAEVTQLIATARGSAMAGKYELFKTMSHSTRQLGIPIGSERIAPLFKSWLPDCQDEWRTIRRVH